MYQQARLKNNAYVDQLAVITKERRSADLASPAKAAADAVNAFVEYAAKHVEDLGVVKWLPVAVDGLVEIGKTIYDYYDKSKKDAAERHAKELVESASWDDWDKVAS